MPSASSHRTELRHTRARPVLMVRALVAISVAVLLVAVPADFFWTYAFNDSVGWDDHRGFLLRAAGVVLFLGVIFTPAVRVETRLPVGRSALGALLIPGSVALFGGAVYALFSLLPALDPAIGHGVSNGTCAVAAAALGLATAPTMAAGRRVLAPRVSPET
jgi:hypothetical protein